MMFLQLCLVKFSISPIIPGAFTFIVLFKQDLLDPSHMLGFLYSGNICFFFSFSFKFILVSISLVATICVNIIYIIFANTTVWVRIRLSKILNL